MEQVSLRVDQIADLSFLITEGKGAMLHDPGVGKTPTVCVYMWHLWTNMGEKSIWVMPKQLFGKNKAELHRFTEFTDDEVVIVEGPKWRELAQTKTAKVLIMGPARHRLSWQEVTSYHPEINAILADEPHMYWSTHGSASTTALYASVAQMRSFVPMTGTIVKGRLDSCYPIIHAIEPRYYASFETFMAHHSYKTDSGKVMWHNTARLAQIFGTHGIKRSFASVYGPEAKVIITEYADMKPLQREAYDEFEAKAILELEEYMLKGSTGGTHALRCRQIMANPEHFGLAKGEKTGKDELLDIHLAHHAASGEPLAVFGVFKPEQYRLNELVRSHGITSEIMNGDTPTKDRIAIDLAYTSGELQCIVGSPQVATVGYNWQHCDHALFPSFDYGDDTFYQAYRRFIRGVRTKPLRITMFQYLNSIDQHIARIITAKSKLANEIDPTREVFVF